MKFWSVDQHIRAIFKLNVLNFLFGFQTSKIFVKANYVVSQTSNSKLLQTK